MDRKRVLALCGVAIAILLAGAWFFLSRRHASSAELVFGATVPMTGQSATFGKWAMAGLEMAVADINEAGGIQGRKVRLVVEDTAGEPARGVTALNKLLDVNKAEVVFSIVSSVDLALVPIADRRNFVLFSHAAHPGITGSGHSRVLRHSNTVAQEADLIVKSLTEQDVASGAAILHLNDDYGNDVVINLRSRLMARFPTARVTDVPYGREETAFTAQVLRALRDNPSAVIVAGVGKSTGLPIRRLREAGFQGRIIATLAFLATDGPSAAGEAAHGVWCVDFVPPEEQTVGNLADRYRQRTGEQKLPMGAVIFYNSAMLWSSARRAEPAGNLDAVVAHVKTMGTFRGKGETMTIDPNGDILPAVHLIQYEVSKQ